MADSLEFDSLTRLEKMQSLDVNLETNRLPCAQRFFSAGSNDKVDAVASDMQEAIGTEVFDQLDFAVEPRLSRVNDLKIHGADSER